MSPGQRAQRSQEEGRAKPGPGDMSGALCPGGIDRISVNSWPLKVVGGYLSPRIDRQMEELNPHRAVQPNKLRATASATLMPSTPADKMPPA